MLQCVIGYVISLYLVILLIDILICYQTIVEIVEISGNLQIKSFLRYIFSCETDDPDMDSVLCFALD